MRNFLSLLYQQKEIKGVIDVSLYDRDGKINLSSSETPAITSIDQNLFSKHDAHKNISIVNGSTISIYSPQIVEPDCIRCHPAWMEDEIGGTLCLTYDLTSLHNTLSQQQKYLLGGGIILLLAMSVMIFFLSRWLVNPVMMMTKAMRELADGNLEAKIPAQDRLDEIGQMAGAVNIFKDNAIDRLKLEQEKELESHRYIP